jgi:PAS domain S-box-containing protein
MSIAGTNEHDSLSAIHPDDRAAAEQAMSRAFRNGVPQIIACRRLSADGTYQLADFRAEPGYPVGVAVDPMVQRPDEPWSIAAELGETGAAVAAAKVVEQLYGVAFAFDATGKFTYTTPVAQTSIAMTLEDLNRPLSDGTFIDGGDLGWKLGVHPDDYEPAAAALRDCMRTGAHFNHECRVLRATGDYVWHRFSIRPTHAADGRITGWFGTGQDVDVEKKATAALRANELRLQQIIDTVPGMLWCLLPDGTVSYVNRRLAETTGVKLEDMKAPGGPRMLSVVHPDYRLAVAQALGHSAETGQPYAMTFPQLRADGSYRWTESRGEALRDEAGAVVQWYGIAVDIHDMVTAQEALRERGRELVHLVDMVPSYIWRLSPDGEPNFYNRRLLDFFGPEAVNAADSGKGRLAAVMQAAVHPDDVKPLDQALRHSLSSGEPFSVRCRIRRADGVYRWTDGRAEPLHDPQGRIIQWYGLSNDIEDQMNADAALRQSEQQFRQLVETMPAMVYCANPDGAPKYRSRQLREFLGISSNDEAVELPHILDGAIHPDDQPEVQERYHHSLSTGEPYRLKHRLRRFDGAYHWVETRAAAMRNEAGVIVQWNGVCFDIDAEVRAQEELRLARERLARASQAASLAELSASIAHEVNQPLAAVVANSHAGQRWLASDPPNIDRAQKAVERIVRDANAAADVVSRIRALFTRITDKRVETALANLFEEVRDLVAEDARRRGVDLDIAVEANLPLVPLDRVQVQQVLVNLMRNGMEAMETTAGRKTLQLQVRRIGDDARVEVSDVGPGIAMPERIFEPFFTTKGHGLGMGLAISRTIVEAHGGRLWAEQNTPKGAKLLFTLPFDLKVP